MHGSPTLVSRDLGDASKDRVFCRQFGKCSKFGSLFGVSVNTSETYAWSPHCSYVSSFTSQKPHQKGSSPLFAVCQCFFNPPNLFGEALCALLILIRKFIINGATRNSKPCRCFVRLAPFQQLYRYRYGRSIFDRRRYSFGSKRSQDPFAFLSIYPMARQLVVHQ